MLCMAKKLLISLFPCTFSMHAHSPHTPGAPVANLLNVDCSPPRTGRLRVLITPSESWKRQLRGSLFIFSDGPGCGARGLFLVTDSC
eukprot:799569-Pelagomonas_calceolata.AAC.1